MGDVIDLDKGEFSYCDENLTTVVRIGTGKQSNMGWLEIKVGNEMGTLEFINGVPINFYKNPRTDYGEAVRVKLNVEEKLKEFGFRFKEHFLSDKNLTDYLSTHFAAIKPYVLTSEPRQSLGTTYADRA